jgi:hypothetical protein
VVKESAADAIFRIRGADDGLGGFTDTKLVLRKSKGGLQGLVFPFTAREVPMGNDSYGEPLTSRIIEWNVEHRSPGPAPNVIGKKALRPS